MDRLYTGRNPEGKRELNRRHDDYVFYRNPVVLFGWSMLLTIVPDRERNRW